MELDIISFILGLILSGTVAWFFSWSEKNSLANRIAFSCCEQALLIISCKRELIMKEEGIEDYDLEALSKIDEKIYPIDIEDFRIEQLPSEFVQSDVHISESVGVFSKRYNLWLLIEFWTMFLEGEEGIRYSNNFYFCKPNFTEKELIKTPYSFNVSKHFLRDKK